MEIDNLTAALQRKVTRSQKQTMSISAFAEKADFFKKKMDQLKTAEEVPYLVAKKERKKKRSEKTNSALRVFTNSNTLHQGKETREKNTWRVLGFLTMATIATSHTHLFLKNHKAKVSTFNFVVLFSFSLPIHKVWKKIPFQRIQTHKRKNKKLETVNNTHHHQIPQNWNSNK